MPVVDPKDARDLEEVQRAVAQVLRRANGEKVKAHVAAYALARLLRELLDFHSPEHRAVHERTIIAFLQHAKESEQTGRLITLQ